MWLLFMKHVMHFSFYHKIVLCDKGGCAGLLYSFERMHNNLFNQFFFVRHLGGCFCFVLGHFTLVNNSVINISVVVAFQLGSSQSPPNPLWHCSWRAHGLGTWCFICLECPSSLSIHQRTHTGSQVSAEMQLPTGSLRRLPRLDQALCCLCL